MVRPYLPTITSPKAKKKIVSLHPRQSVAQVLTRTCKPRLWTPGPKQLAILVEATRELGFEPQLSR